MGGFPPPGQRPGKEKAADSEPAAREKELGYQSPNQELRNIFSNTDSYSGDDERRKKLHILYGGSWKLASLRDVKILHREVLSVKLGVLKAAPH